MRAVLRLMLTLIVLLPLLSCGTTASDVVRGLDKTGTQVPMTAEEAAVLTSIFGSTLDVTKVKLVVGSPVATGAPKTLENTIHFDAKHDLRNLDYRRSARHLMLLAHEATHVWQFQNKGHAYIPDSLFNQAVGAVVHDDRNQAYAYDLDAGKTLASYNSEQQAQIIEGYVALKGFGFVPPRCKNFEALGTEAFLKGAETILQRDLHGQFEGIDRKLLARLTAKD